MIDCVAINADKEMSANYEYFPCVTIDSIPVLICCLTELLACLVLASVWLTAIQIFNRSLLILTAVNAQT